MNTVIMSETAGETPLVEGDIYVVDDYVSILARVGPNNAKEEFNLIPLENGNRYSQGRTKVEMQMFLQRADIKHIGRCKITIEPIK